MQLTCEKTAPPKEKLNFPNFNFFSLSNPNPNHEVIIVIIVIKGPNRVRGNGLAKGRRSVSRVVIITNILPRGLVKHQVQVVLEGLVRLSILVLPATTTIIPVSLSLILCHFTVAHNLNLIKGHAKGLAKLIISLNLIHIFNDVPVTVFTVRNMN